MFGKFTFDVPVAVLALGYPILRHQGDSRLLNFVPLTVLKCLPMVFLIGALTLQQRRSKQGNSYRQNILAGLIFSTVGDAFLANTDVWTDALLGGIAAFGVAHLFFIAAFGLTPFRISGAAIWVTIQVIAFFVLRQPLVEMGSLYLIVVPVYVSLLLGMAWRATAQAEAGKENKPGCAKLKKLGAISFVFSDSILALTEVTGMISHKVVSPQLSTYLVLFSYYFAQYCFAKSAVHEGNANTGKNLQGAPKKAPSKSKNGKKRE